MDFNKQLHNFRARVELGICELVPTSETRPNRLHSAMRYSMQAGGKRLRPVLLLAAQELFSQEIDPIPAAVAVECLHCYSLIDDDLPCMDNSNLRRGKPSCHIEFDEATAVLAGDALLTHAFRLLGAGYSDHARVATRLVAILGEAAGSEHLIGGQMEDISNEGSTPDDETLDYIHRNKTAALLIASLQMGAVLGKANKEEEQIILKLGECVGLTFQIVDDLLDQTGNSTLIGKPVGSDREKNKTTYLSLHSMEQTRVRVDSLTTQASELCTKLGGDNSFLEWLVRDMACRVN